ncbi:hypothetical protein HYZ41_00100 [archaeon]|nr:hypothetical protein [archaeon]
MAQQINKSGTLGYKILVAVLVIVIAALFYTQTTGSTTMIDKAKAEQNTKDLYKIITGGDVEIMKAEEVSGVYRMSIRIKSTTGTDTLQDIYVTKDGQYFSTVLVNLEAQKTVLAVQSAFTQCLLGKKVVIFGLSTDQATQVQLQSLGAFSTNLYFDCSGQNLAVCQQLNITSVPTIFVNGVNVPGPQSVQWFEQNIGCYMTMNGTAP